MGRGPSCTVHVVGEVRWVRIVCAAGNWSVQRYCGVPTLSIGMAPVGIHGPHMSRPCGPLLAPDSWHAGGTRANWQEHIRNTAGSAGPMPSCTLPLIKFSYVSAPHDKQLIKLGLTHSETNAHIKLDWLRRNSLALPLLRLPLPALATVVENNRPLLCHSRETTAAASNCSS